MNYFGKIPIAGAMLINARSEILLQHRDNIPTIASPNKWSFFGGHIEKDEHPDAALVREIEEEIGYQLLHYQLFAMLHRPKTLAHVYLAPIDRECHELTLLEGQDFGFFTLDNALANLDLTGFTRASIQMLQIYQNYREKHCEARLFDF